MNAETKKKLTNKEILDYSYRMSLGYAVCDGIGSGAIEDEDLSALWAEAQEKLWAIRKYLNSAESGDAW